VATLEVCDARGKVVLLTTTSQRHGKRFVIKLRACGEDSDGRRLELLGEPLELEGASFTGAVVWGYTVAVALCGLREGAVQVWDLPWNERAVRSRALGPRAVEPKGRWSREPLSGAWPRHASRVKCDGSGERLLVWTTEACPHVSVWTAGRYNKPAAVFRLALSIGGELLTATPRSSEASTRAEQWPLPTGASWGSCSYSLRPTVVFVPGRWTDTRHLESLDRQTAFQRSSSRRANNKSMGSSFHPTKENGG
jgi:hypothetical protein